MESSIDAIAPPGTARGTAADRTARRRRWRCWRCGRLLAKAYVEGISSIEIQCRCDAINTIPPPTPENERPDAAGGRLADRPAMS